MKRNLFHVGSAMLGGFTAHCLLATPTYAQTLNNDQRNRIFFWCGVLLAASVIIVLAFWILRRKLMAEDDDPGAGTMGLGFSLSDLRKMHEDGQLTDDEFIYAKRKLVAKARANLTGPGDDPDAENDPVFIDPADKDSDLPDDPDKIDGDTPPPRGG